MNILFICKYNRFRSKVAEALFNKYNKNSKNKARSSGIFPGWKIFDKDELAVARKLGVKLKGTPKPTDIKIRMWQDKTIVVADDIPRSLFGGTSKIENLEIWKIPDAKSNNHKKIEKIIKEIERRVKKLV